MYLTLDTETGGLDQSTSLLTAYFGVVHPKTFELVDELYLYIKHDEYVVTAQGLAVNKINLVEHDARAEYKTTAGNKLRNFLKRNYEQAPDKLTPVGHGVAFDLPFIYSQLLNRATWEQFVSYRRLDTGTIAQFLRATGHLPSYVEGSLSALAAHYDIQPDGELHDARTDALLTIAVLKRQMFDMMVVGSSLVYTIDKP